MIFVEFTPANSLTPRTRHFFVGASLGDVLWDTHGGKEFAGEIFSSHRIVSFEEVRAHNFEFFDAGVAAIKNGGKSFSLGHAELRAR